MTETIKHSMPSDAIFEALAMKHMGTCPEGIKEFSLAISDQINRLRVADFEYQVAAMAEQIERLEFQNENLYIKLKSRSKAEAEARTNGYDEKWLSEALASGSNRVDCLRKLRGSGLSLAATAWVLGVAPSTARSMERRA